MDPTSRLWGHRRPRDAVPTSHLVPGVSMHVRAAAPQPRSREPWCLGFPTERAGLGAAPCAPASPQSILPTLLPPPGRPPHPLPTRPRLPMASPDTSHKRRSVVLPGPLNSARLCVLGKGCAGGGARWAPVVPRIAQGRAGGWGLGEQAGRLPGDPRSRGSGPWQPGLPAQVPPEPHGCLLGRDSLGSLVTWPAGAALAGARDTGPGQAIWVTLGSGP